jgi:acetolactate synthase-1/2/3 large subunit
MNGAESLVRTLVGGGATCALPIRALGCILSALDRVDGALRARPLRGRVTGAADGARMTGTPAATLLHLVPEWPTARQYPQRQQGVDADGQYRRRPRSLPSPLRRAADHRHETAARPFAWVKTSPDAGLGRADGAAAIAAARVPPGQIAVLILPADTRGTRARPAEATGRGAHTGISRGGRRGARYCARVSPVCCC